MTNDVLSGWRQYSSSDVFYLFVKPSILPYEAEFLEGILQLSIKSEHRFAAANQSLKDQMSAEVRKSSKEYWEELKQHWNKPEATP